MKNNIQFAIKDYILKITGIFHYDEKFIKKATQSGYKNLEFTPEELIFNKDYFYPDLRRQFFSNEKKRHPILIKKGDDSNTIELYSTNNGKSQKTKKVNISIKDTRLDLFDDGFGLFTISLKICTTKDKIDLNLFSDASFLVRNFQTFIDHPKHKHWYEYIENEILLGYSTRGESIKSDKYSGTKYKLFMVLDIPELEEKEMIKPLLFDIATISKIGSATDTTYDSMDKNYIDQLMKNNSITIYNNWEGLILLDTFTVIGNKILDIDYKKVTYDSIYHSIYLYCLFIKFNLFKFNFEMVDMNEDKRKYFYDFIDKYYYYYISYNFLPTEIYNKIKIGLDIEKELLLLNEKIVSVGQRIQEDQQDKTNKILGVVTVLSSISSIEPVYGYLLIGQKWLGWNVTLYWIAVLAITLITAAGVMLYVFGNKLIQSLINKK